MKGAHSRIAEEADDSANHAGGVIVIDLGGGSFVANGAETALLLNEGIDLVRANPIPLL
jgi:hypothetical protein